jgi:antitoxin HigA-1
MAHLLSVDFQRTFRSADRRLSLTMKTTDIPLGPAQNSPGEILKEEFLTPLGISLRELARRMGCGPMLVSEIVRGKRSVTARTSILLGRALGISPAFFLGLQMDHDLAREAMKLQKSAA